MLLFDYLDFHPKHNLPKIPTFDGGKTLPSQNGGGNVLYIYILFASFALGQHLQTWDKIT